MPAPVIDLSDLMNSTLPSIQVDGYHYEQRPIMEGELGRTATQVRVEGTGFIMATDPASFRAAIAAMETAVDGANFIIYGQQESVLCQVLAANCLDGGPHIVFEVLDEEMGPLYARVKFAVEANALSTGGVVNAYNFKIVTAPDGLQKITQVGKLACINARTLFSSLVLTPFQTTYSLPDYVVNYEVNYPYGNDGQAFTSIARYQMQAAQLAGPLPDVTGAVDGEVTVRNETDNEAHRSIDTFEFSLNLKPTADPGDAIDTLRGLAIAQQPTDPAPMLIRESSNYTTIRQLRLTASFVFLSTTDGTDVMTNYTRTISVTTADPAYQEFAYPGTSPIAIQRPRVFARISDSGSATGLGSFIQAPASLLPDTPERPPVIRLVDVNDFEKQTSWQFESIDVDGMVSSDLSTIASEIVRPVSPETY
jgi:hypothetical protein